MNFDWFAQNPFNLYECTNCGQHYKCNDDPNNVLKENCFRCNCSNWEIRQGWKLRPSFNTWSERIKWSEEFAQHDEEF